MPRPGKIIPKAPLGKIMQNVGAKRVSNGALDTLSDYLIDYATEIAERAAKIARHSGRKTVKKDDVKIAVK